MEVTKGPQGTTPTLPDPRNAPARLDADWAAELLGRWQQSELRVAERFWECRSLNSAQIQDLYQETLIALLNRPFSDELHLQRMLRRGIKRRALNLYRDERRRQEILRDSASNQHPLESEGEHDQTPEQRALMREDELLVAEFLTELSPEEQEVFDLHADGLGYSMIAKALTITVAESRALLRACERKRKRFVLLYETGRLCGYRASIIRALEVEQSTSRELAQQALAHLNACSRCRAEHKTSARRLRARFQEQAAALMPLPILAAGLSPLARVWGRARSLTYRAPGGWSSPTQGALRERVAALLAGGGGVKVTAGIVTAAAIAGSTIAASHHTTSHTHGKPHHRVELALPGAAVRPAASIASAAIYRAPQPQHRVHRPRKQPLSPGSVVPAHQLAKSKRQTKTEPGGFAYLGVDASTTRPPPAKSAATPAPVQHGGGPFGP